MRKYVILILFVLIIICTGCSANPDATYRVWYHGNENTYGFPPNDPNEYKTGMEAVVLGSNTLLKTGYVFKNWNTKQDGAGTSYDAGSKITIKNLAVFLYAMWTPAP
ncbi:MAG: InlB B-repeat-containing protein [Defluviitaleaceae bacterium]|nr:InlB B-repeat-containing protein [Defluviitaleaceae bacterium]